MTEPMTDAPHRPIDGLRAERDAAVRILEAGRHAFNDLDPRGKTILDFMNEWLDQARAANARLTAERDAALARAMPEPVLMETVEQVGALTTGAYRILAPWRPREWLLGRRHPKGTWTLLIDTGASGVMDDHIAGSWVQRLPDLPDLPIPTPTQEG